MTPAKRTEEATQRLRADLIGHARRIVARDGAAGLTMRTLAAEAGCAVGLIYKVFSSREEIVSALLREEFGHLSQALETWVSEAGTRTVGENLARYARLLLDSPVVALVAEVEHDHATAPSVDAQAAETGVVTALGSAVVRYLTREKELGRIDPDVDEDAFAFLIAGSVHNLIVSGVLYPRPPLDRIEAILRALAARLSMTFPAGGEDAAHA